MSIRELIVRQRFLSRLFMEEYLGRLRLKRGLRSQLAWAHQRTQALLALLRNQDILVVVVVTLAAFGVLAGAVALLGDIAWLLAASVLFAGLVSLVISQADIASRQRYSALTTEQQFRQMEALVGLLSVLKIREPLPPMRGFAISPDLANLIVSLINERKPRTVVEVGSGVSTLIVGYCLTSQGEGECLSLEHDESYVDISARNVAKHGLEEFAHVVHAPLRKVMASGSEWMWYDTQVLADVDSIDLLIVDGPPGDTQRLARYPALPLLIEKLGSGAVVVLDDCHKADEREIVRRWAEEFPEFAMEVVDTVRGTAVFRKG